jgi:hypothetical protein
MKRKTNAYFEGDQRNYGSWAHEKTSNVLMELCSLIDKIDVEQSESRSCLMLALHDCLKLYAFLSGDWDLYCDDVEVFLAEHGLEGFRHLEYVSGNSSLKDSFSLQLEDNNTIKEIFELITPTNNRTKIYDKLAGLSVKNKWCVNIKNDLELVTMGEQKWEWFYERHKSDNINDVVVNIGTLIMEKSTM